MAQNARPALFGRLFRRRRVPEQIVVEVRFDDEAGVYYVASSTLKGLHVEADTLDEMQREIVSAASDLLADRQNGTRPGRDIIMQSAAHCAA